MARVRRVVSMMRDSLGGITNIVRIILTTSVEQPHGEVAICHLKSIVQCPQGRSKCITNAREPTARSSICFEHQEGLVVSLGNTGGIEITLK